MTLLYRGHIFRTTYFSVRGDLFFLGGTYLLPLFTELPRRGILGNLEEHGFAES
jgi:hypothetical protein